MRVNKNELKKITVGVAFLLPNILGFLAFVAGPLVISLIMSFTNWNLELHNVFRNEPIEFVGLKNYADLLDEPDFLRYLGNTLFFMIGIPFGVGGSLCAALLLNGDFKGGSRKAWGIAMMAAILVVSMGALVITGLGATAITVLVCGLVGVILVGGSIGGQTVYRTLFYFPYFTAGVATFILWKKLYSPDTGPINNALRPLFDFLAPTLAQLPPSLAHACSFGLSLSVALLFIYMVRKDCQLWSDGENGTLCLILGTAILSLPLFMGLYWNSSANLSYVYIAVLTGTALYLIYKVMTGRKHTCPIDRGMSSAVVLGGMVMVFGFILLGLGILVYDLPQISTDGLEPPKWIADYYWAKPSLMIMGFWGAIGSNNMLLYLAGLSGVPQDLYEAADIDGANSFQRFWNITWPQLANVTFFILVMSVIGGLQGGFEMARTMTEGGPAGATTTLSYYIYSEGFATGRLGYASAVAWTLFALIFSVTAFNWKFGNRYANE